MLEAKHLGCTRGDRLLFSRVSFSINAGQILYLQGRNGTGKTSLLRILCALSPAAEGEVFWQGQNIHEMGDSFHAQLCYLGHQNAIKEEMTPLENLQAAARLAGSPLNEDDAVAALAEMGLASRADLACRHLSQGQKRRVTLCRLVTETRPLWILDEPFVALDAAAVDFVAELIARHLGRKGCVVLTTHQKFDLPAGQAQEFYLGR